jgi:hypothetical protein
MEHFSLKRLNPWDVGDPRQRIMSIGYKDSIEDFRFNGAVLSFTLNENLRPVFLDRRDARLFLVPQRDLGNLRIKLNIVEELKLLAIVLQILQDSMMRRKGFITVPWMFLKGHEWHGNDGT